MKNKGHIFGQIKTAHKSVGKEDVQVLQKAEKYDRGLHFGVTDAQYSEFLALKKKWGLRSMAEAARRVWLLGLQIEMGVDGKKKKGRVS